MNFRSLPVLTLPITSKIWPDLTFPQPITCCHHKTGRTTCPHLGNLDNFSACDSINHSSEAYLSVCVDYPLLIRFGSSVENPTGACCACIHLPRINHPNFLASVCVFVCVWSGLIPIHLWGLTRQLTDLMRIFMFIRTYWRALILILGVTIWDKGFA